MSLASLLRHARVLLPALAFPVLAFAKPSFHPSWGPNPKRPGYRPLPVVNCAPVTPASIADTAYFDTTTAPLPPNVTSLGFQANAAAELGDLIQFAGGGAGVDRMTVTMSSWALRSEWPGSSAAGFNHPITLKIYAVDRSTGTPRTGALLTSITQSFLIPWRPEADPSTGSPTGPWLASDGNYYTGLAFNIDFNLTGIALPGEVVYSIGFNTRSYGAAPRGVPGPYDSLNVGFSEVAPTVGTDVEPGSVFWKTPIAANYSDGGAAGFGILRRDTGWAQYSPAVRFTGSNYSSLAAAATSLRALHSSDRKLEAKLRAAEQLVDLSLSRALWKDTSRLRPLVGILAFELLSEAAETLDDVSSSKTAAAAPALALTKALLGSAESAAATEIAYAIDANGKAKLIAKAQDAFDAAAKDEAKGKYAKAIDDLGDAWLNADLAAH